MNTTFDVLVIVLSCLLGLFLILSIAVMVAVLKLVRAAGRIMEKGEEVVEAAEVAALALKRSAGPLGLIKTVTRITKAMNKRRKG